MPSSFLATTLESRPEECGCAVGAVLALVAGCLVYKRQLRRCRAEVGMSCLEHRRSAP
jgi:hypothetical protein